MADVVIANAQYNDVPSVEIPKQGGGVASFMDTSDADAIASEIDMGKTAYVNGVKLTGTRSGGGGGTGRLGSALIPVLTSNTGDNGEAFSSFSINNYGSNPYYAFNNDLGTYTYFEAENKVGGYVGYNFTDPVTVGYIGYIISGYSISGMESHVQYQDEDDNWITVSHFNACGNSWNTYLADEIIIKLPFPTTIKAVRALSGFKSSNNNMIVRKLQVYASA